MLDVRRGSFELCRSRSFVLLAVVAGAIDNLLDNYLTLMWMHLKLVECFFVEEFPEAVAVELKFLSIPFDDAMTILY